MQPLRRNLGAYCGERIHVPEVAGAIAAAAESGGGSVSWIPVTGGGEMLTVVIAKASPPRRRVYLSAGIHGDEPAGPMALLGLLREGGWPDDCELWMCPLLNPEGFARSTREDHEGVDLNRDYRLRRRPRVRAHVDWLKAAPRFDCGIHLHEDWEATGFYLYELNPRRRRACCGQVIAAVRPICPIDPADQIDGRKARGGILRPDVDPDSRDDWPEAFFMVQEKTDLSYTLESPSDFPLAVRVRALETAVRTILGEVCA